MSARKVIMYNRHPWLGLLVFPLCWGCGGASEQPPESAAQATPVTTVDLDADATAETEEEGQAEFGMIGLLNTGAGGDPDAPTAPWGDDDSLGDDVLEARGNMWGDSVGEAFGEGGLGLAGIGEGGGGTGEGIGLGSVGTLGGVGAGSGVGFGTGSGKLGTTKTVKVRMGATNVSGRLPPEVIQRIVRQKLGRYRACYEQALLKDPKLEARVNVRFVIARDGSVSTADDSNGTAPKDMSTCVVVAFKSLKFPQPEGGVVSVSYPLVFTPGDSAAKPAPAPAAAP